MSKCGLCGSVRSILPSVARKKLEDIELKLIKRKEKRDARRKAK